MVDVVEPGSALRAFGAALPTFRSAAGLVLELREVAHARMVELAEPRSGPALDAMLRHPPQQAPSRCWRDAGRQADLSSSEQDSSAGSSSPRKEPLMLERSGTSTTLSRSRSRPVMLGRNSRSPGRRRSISSPKAARSTCTRASSAKICVQPRASRRCVACFSEPRTATASSLGEATRSRLPNGSSKPPRNSA